MFDEVIVGVNFGPGGDEAIALAAQLVSRTGRLTLTHIVASDPTVARGQRDDDIALERARSLGLLERERSLMHLDRTTRERPVRIEVCALPAASTGRGLHAAALTRRADLIVAGATRHGRVGGVLFGDGTCGVLRAAPCSVAVAPRGYTGDRPLRRIGAGDDRPAGDGRAWEVARALAARDHLEIEVAPGGELTELAAFSREVDLLVLASPYPGRWRRRAAQRRPGRLARQAACPLLVIPGSRTQADGSRDNLNSGLSREVPAGR
jgi:nucleotide-binding universal stress UspA family protein